MSLAQADFSSVALRGSLKRGLARQAVTGAVEADLPQVFTLTREMRPNHKAQDRLAARLAAMPGVVRVTRTEAGLVAILRNRREMVSTCEAQALYAEETLFYTRLSITPGRLTTGYHISRASLSRHALERLIERSRLALDQPLLQAVDAEAVTILRHAARGRLIEDGEDQFASALQDGVWAGRVDLSDLEPDWGLDSPHGARVPVFSARTFLAPDQMRPTLWARWRADPSLTVH